MMMHCIDKERILPAGELRFKLPGLCSQQGDNYVELHWPEGKAVTYDQLCGELADVYEYNEVDTALEALAKQLIDRRLMTGRPIAFRPRNEMHINDDKIADEIGSWTNNANDVAE